MQQLGLNEESDLMVKEGFWRRQFQKETTGAQRKFDWTFGVVLPVACFFFDPIVFKGGIFGDALLGTFKPFAYLLSFASIMAMMAWLLWGDKLKWLNAFLAGLFLVGGLISLGVGVVLMPFSVAGLFILIGVLGFTPLFTALVYTRSAFRSYQAAKPFIEKGVLINSLILTAILSIVVPSVAAVRIKRAMNRLEKGNAQTIRYETQRLKYVAPIANFDALVKRYRYEKDNAEEMEALAEAYKNLAGESIEKRLRTFD